MDIIILILSSGFVSFIVTLLTLFIKIGTYKNKVDKHDKDIDVLQNEMKKCTNKISEMIGASNAKAGGMLHNMSPLSLTEKGHKILGESGAKEYIDERTDFLLDEIRHLSPKSLYDVQEYSKKVIDLHKNDDNFVKIKNYVYAEGLELDHVIMGMAIYLRDYAFEEIAFQNTGDSN